MYLSEISYSYGFIVIFLIFTALLFYLVIPVGGAFYVRKKWRKFRQNLRRSLDLPMVVPGFRRDDGSLGLHRFLGELEAIEGDDLLWIHGALGTITADMRNASVYNMTDTGSNSQLYKNLYPYPFPKTSLVHMS